MIYQELTGPTTYRLPRPLTLRAVWGGLLWLVTGDVSQATRRGWIVVVNVECK